MARGTRVDAPGAFHHVMIRGIEGRDVFRDALDRERFLARLQGVAAATGTRFGAWAFMSNHVHLLVRTGSVPLAEFMQRLGTGYVRYFNRRHDRRGYLFQGRYKSLLIEDDAYLLVLLRYIHCNPLRAGAVESLEALAAYPWTGHAALMGRTQDPSLLVDDVLARFGSDAREARKRLLDWMRIETGAACDAGPSATPSMAGMKRIEGTPLHRDAGLIAPDDRAVGYLSDLSEIEARKAAAVARYGSIDRLIDRVCAALGADPQQVRNGRRARCEARARAVIASIARRELGLPYTTIAPALGVTIAAASRAASRGVAIANEAGLAQPRKKVS